MKGDSRRGVDGIDNAILNRSGRTCREIMLLVSFENLKFLTSFSIFDLFDLLKIFNKVSWKKVTRIVIKKNYDLKKFKVICNSIS